MKTKSLLYVALLLGMPPANAQQQQLKNLTAKQYQKEFDRLVTLGYRPIKIESKTLSVFDYQPGERPQLGFWAIFEKRPNTTAWVARHGINADAYQREFTNWTRQGYMPTDLNIAFMDGRSSYCVIFDKVPNQPVWVARHGLNQADFTKTNTDLIQQGFTRRLTSSCQTQQGRAYVALWVKR